jgi:hypothetical protein
MQSHLRINLAAMRSFLLPCSLLIIALLASAYKPHVCVLDTNTWGFFGHKKINELAIYTLPEELFGFYKSNMDYLIDHSVDPDKRRYSVKGEAECHYIDMDRYVTADEPNPFATVPRRWDDAVAKFSEDTLRAHGIVPWNVYLVQQRLTAAFRNEDINRIKYVKRLLNRYDKKKILKERLILNHIIILNNVFGNEACSRILFYKVCPHLHPYLRSFLDYLQILPRKIPEVDLNKTPSDHRITTILNELK